MVGVLGALPEGGGTGAGGVSILLGRVKVEEDTGAHRHGEGTT